MRGRREAGRTKVYWVAELKLSQQAETIGEVKLCYRNREISESFLMKISY